MQNRTLILLLILSIPWLASGTHNRAGEITYRHLSGLTYEVTVLTYTFAPSLANRDSLYVNWGDGTPVTTVYIDQKIFLPNDNRYNTYIGVHTFPGPGYYTISMEDPNRNAGIINIDGSVNEPFYIESLLLINPFLGPNSSPILLEPPIDIACLGNPFLHNPTAFDPDGDSLSYSLITCKGENGNDINTYTFPPASNSLAIDPVTGELLWDSPTLNGDFNFAILIEEWRSGVRIGYIIRDMQVFVTPCNNQPPVIAPVNDTCVIVGDTLQFALNATDPNVTQVLTLTAAGGPLTLSSSPATFLSSQSSTPATGIFQWAPDCSAVQKQPYLVSFKATDDGSPVNLFDLESVFITVIAPPPDTLTAYPLGNTMVIDWSISPCPGASGYSLYRKIGSSNFTPGPCITGVPAWTGFEKIATLNGLNNTLFIDDNNGNGLFHGLLYCYRVVADFPDGAQSLASYEICSELKRDVPVITNISISHTDSLNGTSYIAWAPPSEIDTSLAPGPYKYLIYRSDNHSPNFILIDSLSSLSDTIFHDSLINTYAHKFFYRIDLFNDQPGNRFLIGSTNRASSVFLNLTPADQKMELTWDPITPWLNLLYVIYRFNPSTSTFDSIGSTPLLNFTDLNLNNDSTYCYYVESIGTYGTVNIIDPIINVSQKPCAIPIDNEGPCIEPIHVTTDCISNTVIWSIPPVHCAKDIAFYELWYTHTIQGDYKLIHTTTSPYDTLFIHSLQPASIVGCYMIRGIDSTGNTGPFSPPFCIDSDSCDLYRIPNVFTPNNDQKNDLLKPFPYSNVDRIDLTIMSRWGNEVFTTKNPEINWDGRHQQSGQELSAGVYYYVCDVWFQGLEGTRKRTLHGIVHLMR